MKRKFIAYTIASLIFNFGFTKAFAQDNTEQKIRNVAYGTFKSSKMDVYLPANRNAKTPFVILIHGGAWIMGDKFLSTAVQEAMLVKGIASININYRFADNLQIHYSEMLADIDSAVNYCIAHAAEWNTRTNGFITSGHSAGGHLALLYAYSTSKNISAIIAEAAPTDITDTAFLNYQTRIGMISVVEKMANGKYIPGKPQPPGYKASSPLYQVKNIPVLLIHGTLDKTVPYSQSVKLDSLLQSKNIVHKFLPIEGAGHDLNLNDPKTKNLINDEMITWAIKYGN